MIENLNKEFKFEPFASAGGMIESREICIGNCFGGPLRVDPRFKTGAADGQTAAATVPSKAQPRQTHGGGRGSSREKGEIDEKSEWGWREVRNKVNQSWEQFREKGGEMRGQVKAATKAEGREAGAGGVEGNWSKCLSSTFAFQFPTNQEAADSFPECCMAGGGGG